MTSEPGQRFDLENRFRNLFLDPKYFAMVSPKTQASCLRTRHEKTKVE